MLGVPIQKTCSHRLSTHNNWFIKPLRGKPQRRRQYIVGSPASLLCLFYLGLTITDHILITDQVLMTDNVSIIDHILMTDNMKGHKYV